MTFTKKTILIHATLWLSYLMLLIWLYSESREHFTDPLRSIFIVMVQVIIFYLNFYLLLPRYFETKRYTAYIISILAVLIASFLLFFLFDKISFDIEFRKAIESDDFSRIPHEMRGRGRFRRPPPWTEPWQFGFIWRSVLFNGFFVVIALFISTVYRNLVVNQQKEKESLKLISQVREAESNLLKSQINPHFLFNTLNNIYSMAQLKSDQTADAVHRLSEMLRYVIYDCNQNLVKLGQEVNYIKSYIELQLLKDEKMQHIKYDIDNVREELMIAPMLLIPFIENSFKHSHIEDPENSWIRIALQTEGANLFLETSNSIPATPVTKDDTGGVGLENVKKRLSLLYGGRHQLLISRTETEFKVELNILLDEN